MLTGNSGPIGDCGPTGDCGPIGDCGPTGDCGPIGDCGPTGNSGSTGDSVLIQAVFMTNYICCCRVLAYFSNLITLNGNFEHCSKLPHVTFKVAHNILNWFSSLK